MFLKRDLGSPLNCSAVDEVLQRHWVLPLNSPPAWPQYNGSMERGMRDLKSALDARRGESLATPFSVQVELVTHQLNHRRLRSLGRLTPCQVYHDPARLGRRWCPCGSTTPPPGKRFTVKFASSTGSMSDVCPEGIPTTGTPRGASSWNPGSAARAGSPSAKTTKPMCQPFPKLFSLRNSFALHTLRIVGSRSSLFTNVVSLHLNRRRSGVVPCVR
jgi:hypothetical protein